MNAMDILIVREPISLDLVRQLAEAWYGDIVKGVADCKRDIIALGGEWHMDANERLILDGSEQSDLWGFNLIPAERGPAAIEYQSLVNIRPAQNNRSQIIEDEHVRLRIAEIVRHLVPDLDV